MNEIFLTIINLTGPKRYTQHIGQCENGVDEYENIEMYAQSIITNTINKAYNNCCSSKAKIEVIRRKPTNIVSTSIFKINVYETE
jgi:hypothetical protein